MAFWKHLAQEEKELCRRKSPRNINSISLEIDIAARVKKEEEQKFVGVNQDEETRPSNL